MDLNLPGQEDSSDSDSLDMSTLDLNFAKAALGEKAPRRESQYTPKIQKEFDSPEGKSDTSVPNNTTKVEVFQWFTITTNAQMPVYEEQHKKDLDQSDNQGSDTTTGGVLGVLSSAPKQKENMLGKTNWTELENQIIDESSDEDF